MKTKLLIAILFIISSYNSSGQLTIDESKTNYPVVGFSTEYSFSHNVVNAGLQFGYRFNDVYLSGDMIIPLSGNVFAPKIFTVNAGLNLSQFQPFISCNYSTIGGEAEQLYKGTENEFINGFRFGYGIRYYLRLMPLAFTMQRQGKESVISVCIYKAL